MYREIKANFLQKNNNSEIFSELSANISYKSVLTEFILQTNNCFNSIKFTLAHID